MRQDEKWPIEFIANGEIQVVAWLTEKEIQAITKQIRDIAVT